MRTSAASRMTYIKERPDRPAPHPSTPPATYRTSTLCTSPFSNANSFPVGLSTLTNVSRWLSMILQFQKFTYTGNVHATTYPSAGTVSAKCTPHASITAPMIGRNTIPPLIAATCRLPSSFVCRPSPRKLNVKIVAKQVDSKAKTVMSRPMDTVPVVFMAAMAMAKQSARKANKISRGFARGDIMAKPEMKRMPA